MTKSFSLIVVCVCLISISKRSSSTSFYSSLFSSRNDENLTKECETKWRNETFIGICAKENECEGFSGEDYCGQGMVCCVIINKCGEMSVKRNLTYFVNNNYPNELNEPISCTLKVKKIDDDEKVCQIRLDFDEFNVKGPEMNEIRFRYHPSTSNSPTVLNSINRNSNCKDDLFVVHHSNRNIQIPILCGQNRGHHLYIPVRNSIHSDSILLTFLIGNENYERKWKIKIQQILCSDYDQLAPSGCLQYYRQPTGTIRTFNYDGNQYLKNIDYSICIRRPKDFCFLTFKRNPPPPPPPPPPVFLLPLLFSTSTNAPMLNNSSEETATFVREERRMKKMKHNSIFINGTIVEARTIIHDKCHQADYWITWPGTDRICSDDIDALNIPITIATSAPQVIHFFSSPWDETKKSEELRGASKGFSLNYTHSPCTHGFH